MLYVLPGGLGCLCGVSSCTRSDSLYKFAMVHGKVEAINNRYNLWQLGHTKTLLTMLSNIVSPVVMLHSNCIFQFSRSN